MKTVIGAIIVIATLTSCMGERKRNEQIIQQMTVQNDSLQYVVSNKDSIINDALLTISDIAVSLNEIKRKEGLVVSQAEVGKVPKEQIKADLNDIAAILKEKNEQLKRLEKATGQLSKANVEIEGLQKLVAEMTRQVKEKDATIASMLKNIDNLKEEIAKLNTEIVSAEQENQNLTQNLEQTTNDLNTAYYIAGEEKFLLESGILIKKGAIGRTLAVNPDLDKSKLTKIDIRNVDRIEIKGKKVEIIGSFPTSSYSLEEGEGKKEINALLIQDKEAYWKNDKILVISYK